MHAKVGAEWMLRSVLWMLGGSFMDADMGAELDGC